MNKNAELPLQASFSHLDYLRLLNTLRCLNDRLRARPWLELCPSGSGPPVWKTLEPPLSVSLPVLLLSLETGASERFRMWGGGTNLYEPYTILCLKFWLGGHKGYKSWTWEVQCTPCPHSSDATVWRYPNFPSTRCIAVRSVQQFRYSTAIGLSRQMDRRCGGVRDGSSMGINSDHVLGLRLSITQRISRTR